MNVCKVRSMNDRSMSNKSSGEVRPYSGSSSMQVQGTYEPNIVKVGAAITTPSYCIFISYLAEHCTGISLISQGIFSHIGNVVACIQFSHVFTHRNTQR
jgi:hypothetical protein